MTIGHIVKVTLESMGDPSRKTSELYAVAVYDPREAVAMVRRLYDGPGDKVEVISELSENAIEGLGIAPGSFRAFSLDDPGS